jgi:predicted RNA-binding protein YlxR (DUF448 family)
MPKKLNRPVRMCITCRGRYAQNELHRLQCLHDSLEKYKAIGRSFYICKTCLKDEKKVLKSLMRQCRSGEKDKFTSRLKEIITDDRES